MRNAIILSLLGTVATLAACSADGALDTSQSDDALRRRHPGHHMNVDAGNSGAADSGTATPDAGSVPPSRDAGTTGPSGQCAPAPGSSTVVDVTTTGAKGDGSTDDTAAIQRAVTQAASSKGTVLIPDGTYMIDALTSVNVASNVTLKLSSGATLKAFPNSSENYSVLQISGSDVTIVGGTIAGERAQHSGSTGEWGMGINVDGASGTVIDSVTIKDMWGDGIYLANQASNTTICSVVADNNRRQGMSIVGADGVVVKSSTFKNTNGTEPKSGIDIEPNSGTSVSNVDIENSTFTDNAGAGINIYAASGDVSLVTINGNVISGSGNNGGITLVNSSRDTITNNTIHDTNNWGIFLDSTSSQDVVTGNDITVTNGASGHGIDNHGSGNTVSGNTLH